MTTPPLRKTEVACERIPDRTYPAMVPDLLLSDSAATWNGWTLPLFSRETAEEIIDDLPLDEGVAKFSQRGEAVILEPGDRRACDTLRGRRGPLPDWKRSLGVV